MKGKKDFGKKGNIAISILQRGNCDNNKIFTVF